MFALNTMKKGILKQTKKTFTSFYSHHMKYEGIVLKSLQTLTPTAQNLNYSNSSDNSNFKEHNLEHGIKRYQHHTDAGGNYAQRARKEEST